MKRRLKIDGFLSVTLAIFLIYLSVIFYRPKAKVLDYTLDVAGMIVVVFGQILRISGRNYKKQHSKQGGALLTDGPYALARNPMYLGTFLMGVGFVAILWPWWFLLIYVFIFYLRFRNLIISEEDKLTQLFGATYRRYLHTVPRFFPSLAKLLNLPKYLALKWQWVKKEWSVILAWFILVVFIEGIVERENFASMEYLKGLAVLGITCAAAFGFFLLILIKHGAAEKS